MSSMKYTTLVALVFTSLSSFAGGGGGGGVLMSQKNFAGALNGGTDGGGVLSTKSPTVTVGNGSGTIKAEYVKYLGSDRGEIIFEYGQVNEKSELYSQVFKLRAEEFSTEDKPILDTLNKSKDLNEGMFLPK